VYWPKKTAKRRKVKEEKRGEMRKKYTGETIRREASIRIIRNQNAIHNELKLGMGEGKRHIKRPVERTVRRQGPERLHGGS